MNSPTTNNTHGSRMYLYLLLSLSAAILLAPTAALAHDNPILIDPSGFSQDPSRNLVYIIPGKPEISTLYFDGSQIEIQTEQRWTFMHGSDLTGLTIEDLKWYAENHLAAFENGPAVIVDSGGRDGGINIVYNCDETVPSGALSALAMTETYLEGLFSDNITVTLSCRFENMGSGVLGSTGSSLVSNVTYINSRNGLQSGMDGDDVIQSWLPSGNTVPVRYNGSSSAVTNENRITWTRANYNATVGTASGTSASITYNTQVSWDYDPSDGVGWTRFSFVDVACHETGHALGFISAADDAGESMDALDLYRFCRLDGDYDYNPDTYEEFQTTPRIVDFNNPNDQQNSDLIANTYRMADGDPYQASHFRQINDYGCMCPAIGYGETRYPSYYTSADKNMFDALGYEYPPCDTPEFTTQPEPSQTICEGDNFSLTVEVDIPAPTYQWRKVATSLVDDGEHIFGANTNTLLVVGATEDDASSNYNCLVINPADGCPGYSDPAEIIVDTNVPVIIIQPQDQTVDEGDPVTFFILLEDALGMTYQWRKNGNPLSDDGRISGTTTNVVTIDPTQSGDAGEYDCVITYELGAQCSTTSDAATLTISGGHDCPNPGASGNYCTADIDGSGDCIVDLADLALLLSNYGMSTGATHEDGDIDPPEGDGDVDLGDLAALLSQYGDDCN